MHSVLYTPLKAEEGLKEASFMLLRDLPCRTLRVKALPNRRDIYQSKPLHTRSCMQAIENEDISNTLIQKFLIKHTQLLKKRKQITLCWIPSHIGIVGNERADKEAKSSLELDVRPLSIPFTDFLPKAKQFYHNLWQAIWDRSTDFLTLIHPELKKKTYDPSLTRREQRALCRIRIGHTRLTHSYRMDKDAERPKCDTCRCRLTIKHMMVDCPKFNDERQRFLQGSSLEEIYSNSDRAIIVKRVDF